ncbi:hypothetical protein M2444_005577 [Paenibacillus sp. PastF-3]|uniref:hypothetical protein n=1 Tax=Paenibacillus sp. PastF-3 TaxID=2940626 RepID=UPI002474EB06|nr:hypothetical protein [Paenibacillus sp. PastF-3]MDH6373734.1 hypothetical protein [Paenibacillus sp. PastF-3]
MIVKTLNCYNTDITKGIYFHRRLPFRRVKEYIRLTDKKITGIEFAMEIKKHATGMFFLFSMAFFVPKNWEEDNNGNTFGAAS